VQALAGKNKRAAIAGECLLSLAKHVKQLLQNIMCFCTAQRLFKRILVNVLWPTLWRLLLRNCNRFLLPGCWLQQVTSRRFNMASVLLLLCCAGAGVSGPCNPQQRSYHAFFDVLAAGSWLEVVPAGGHMQFAKVTDGVIGRVLDWLCHSGSASHEVSTCDEAGKS
jgi:hypothetical protein